MGAVIDINAARRERQNDRNKILVQCCKGGFEVTFITCTGYRHWLGTYEDLREARTFAHNEAFKAGRCKVSLLCEEDRA